MALDLILTPDLYVPVWSDDDDRVYLVVQPALLDPTDAELEAYLKGFSVPTDPGAATAVGVRLMDAGAALADPLQPVPLPDGAVLTVTPLRGGIPVASLPPLSRTLGSFARLRSFRDYVSANRIFPREFLRTEKRVLSTGDPPQLVYIRWWREVTAAPDFQPENYVGATYAQMLAHQTRRAFLPDPTDSNQTFEGPQRVREQLALSFLVGRPLRLFDDAGHLLFDGLPSDPSGALMVVPDLRPGEDWHATLGDAAHRHSNAAGLCGLTWPVLTRGQLHALPLADVPDAFEVRLTASSGSNWTITFTGSGVFRMPTVGSGGATVSYFQQLRTATDPVAAPAATVGPVPHLSTLDFGRLAFVVDRSRNLVPDGGLAGGLRAAGVAVPWAFSSLNETAPGTAADPSTSGMIDASTLRSISIVVAQDRGGPGAPGTGPSLTAWVVVGGRLVRYRDFAHPQGARHLRRFVPDGPLPAEVVALVRDHVRADGVAQEPVLLLGQTATAGAAPVPVVISADSRSAWVYDEPTGEPTTYQPVFFLESLVASPLAALNEPVRLTFKVSSSFTAAWRTDRLARVAVPAGLTWFNALTCDLPSTNPQPGVVVLPKNQYDMHLALGQAPLAPSPRDLPAARLGLGRGDGRRRPRRRPRARRVGLQGAQRPPPRASRPVRPAADAEQRQPRAGRAGGARSGVGDHGRTPA